MACVVVAPPRGICPPEVSGQLDCFHHSLGLNTGLEGGDEDLLDTGKEGLAVDDYHDNPCLGGRNGAAGYPHNRQITDESASEASMPR